MFPMRGCGGVWSGNGEAVFRLRRALQRDAAARCRAYWAAHNERARDPKALRERLGLTRKGIEAAAKTHIEASRWMRDHLTKAVGLHVANEIWETTNRHLFTDTTGRRSGAPRVGPWRDFTRIPGRARSHTKARPVWETWRLVGTLDGHLATFRHSQLPERVTTAVAATQQSAGASILKQPSRVKTPPKPASASWWDHAGALAIVFTGLPAGDAVLPVRLPQGAGRWPHLAHFLSDPTIWHKIDLVRVQDRHAPGGWRYYANLLVHQAGYQSPATQRRRSQVRLGRRAGVDANVSNLSVASFPEGDPNKLVVEQVRLTTVQKQAAQRAERRVRARQRALDRSRRNSNPDQYGLSPRQVARADRRASNRLAAKRVHHPGGARMARADGVPLRAYRDDVLSRGYQRTRANHAADARARAQAKRTFARETAARLVDAHGNSFTVEDCAISSWARLWGKRIHLFSPGMLIAALVAECDATGGRVLRAATGATALSQHCLCGQRVPKELRQRIHHCLDCGLRADRDIVSASLAACVSFNERDEPASARVDFRLAHALGAGLASQREARAQSTGTSHRQDLPIRRARTGSRHLLASAEQRNHHSAYPRTDQPSWTSRDQPSTSRTKRLRCTHDP